MDKPINELPDEQVETKIKELTEKKDATSQEKEDLGKLKEERATRYQKRLDKLTWEKKTEAEKASKLENELKTQREELEKLKSERHAQAKPIIIDEYVEYGGKKYYTDQSLMAMVESKELDPQEAYKHQQQRLKAEIKHEMETESKQKESQGKNQKTWEEDKAMVLREYPEFNPSHANHNPEDPLYKLASEIYRDDFVVDGNVVNPRALSLSIKRAKQILKMADARPDVSQEQILRRPGSATSAGREEVSLSQLEQETAVRLYGSVVNPKTNKNYTEQEAINKALNAKKARGR